MCLRLRNKVLIPNGNRGSIGAVHRRLKQASRQCLPRIEDATTEFFPFMVVNVTAKCLDLLRSTSRIYGEVPRPASFSRIYGKVPQPASFYLENLRRSASTVDSRGRTKQVEALRRSFSRTKQVEALRRRFSR